MIVSVLVSLVVGYPTLRVKLRSDYFAIATLGFGEALKVILENLDLTQGAAGSPASETGGADQHRRVDGADDLGLPKFPAQHVRRQDHRHRAGPCGRRNDRHPTPANQMLSLGFSAALAGLSGGLLAHYVTFIPAGDLQHGSVESADGRCGVWRQWKPDGPIVATALFVVVPELFRGLALWRLVLYGVLLVVIMNLRPKGLYGHEELNLGNLPKLFSFVGLTVGLTVGAGVYNAYARSGEGFRGCCWRPWLPWAVTAAANYTGRGLAWLLRPVLPRLGATWDRGFDRIVRLFDGLSSPGSARQGRPGRRS